ncbi:hypothetical protein ZWY2020_000451 [Hordeum vulgare]|nr:hypothetical protein ZWY2020_000451 [Hordeum vulgare]
MIASSFASSAISLHDVPNLLNVPLREVEDEVPDARDGDERAGASVPELVLERIPCSENQHRKQQAEPGVEVGRRMGGKSSFSFFCPMFSFLSRSRSSSRYDDGYMSDWEGRPRCGSKVRSSDEDSGWWVGERDVDRKAADYINDFHQKKVSGRLAPPT